MANKGVQGSSNFGRRDKVVAGKLLTGSEDLDIKFINNEEQIESKQFEIILPAFFIKDLGKSNFLSIKLE